VNDVGEVKMVEVRPASSGRRCEIELRDEPSFVLETEDVNCRRIEEGEKRCPALIYIVLVNWFVYSDRTKGEEVDWEGGSAGRESGSGEVEDCSDVVRGCDDGDISDVGKREVRVEV